MLQTPPAPQQLLITQRFPIPCALQSSSVLHTELPQKKSSPQYVLPFASWKQYAAPNSPQVPHCVAGQAGGIPLQIFLAFFFLHLSTDADAGMLLSAGAAHTTAPAIPTLRSSSRREIRFSSNDFTPSR